MADPDPNGPAQAGNGENPASLSALRRWAGAVAGAAFNKWSAGGAGGLVLLLAVAWLAAMPSGDLRLASLPSVANDPDKTALAIRLFNGADSTLKDATRFHRQLSFVEDNGTELIKLPNSAPPNERSLEVFVKDLSVGGQTEGVGASFNLLALLKESYRWVGRTDYFLVVRQIEPAVCPGDGQQKCWRVNAQYWPSVLRPDEFVGTEEDLKRDLAVLALRGAVRNQGDNWRLEAGTEDSPPFLMAAETPATMASLAAVAKGLRMLKLGRAHSDCLDRMVSESKCIALAKASFKAGKDRSGGLTPIAAYGLALTELHAALRAASELQPEWVVEQHLDQVERLTVRALNSAFLRSFVERVDSPREFGLLELHGLVPGEPLIDIAQRFACALADYRRAEWTGCLEKIGDMSDFPAPFRPYLEAARIDSELSAARDESTYKALLTDFKRNLDQWSDSATPADIERLFLLRRVMLKHTCKRPAAFSDNEFSLLAQKASTFAPQESAQWEAIIQAADCRPSAEFPSNQMVTEVVGKIGGRPPTDNERLRFELLLSQYHIRRGELRQAYDLASHALQLPWAGPYVRKAPEFAVLINGPQGQDLIGKTFRTPKLFDLESCSLRE